MRLHYFLLPVVAGIMSACSLGSYPGSGGYPSGGTKQYPTSGQQTPDDTTPTPAVNRVAGGQPTPA